MQARVCRAIDSSSSVGITSTLTVDCDDWISRAERTSVWLRAWSMSMPSSARSLRLFCRINAEFSPKGIHVAHIIVDGAVDAPDTLGKMLGPERFQQLRESRGNENDGLLLPSRIADTYFHLAQQHRSAWTHEIDMRSFSDRPWWNH